MLEACDDARGGGRGAVERAALARRFGLLSLGRLVATLTWRRQAGDLVRLDGVLEASLAQPCVVTLDPVPAELTESFTLRFMRGVAGAVTFGKPWRSNLSVAGEALDDLGPTVAVRLPIRVASRLWNSGSEKVIESRTTEIIT